MTRWARPLLTLCNLTEHFKPIMSQRGGGGGGRYGRARAGYHSQQADGGGGGGSAYGGGGGGASGSAYGGGSGAGGSGSSYGGGGGGGGGGSAYGGGGGSSYGGGRRHGQGSSYGQGGQEARPASGHVPHQGGGGQQTQGMGGQGTGPGDGSAGPGQRKALDLSPPACAQQLPPGVRQAVDAYVQRWGPLLEAELHEEQQTIKARLESWPTARLMSEGLMLQDLEARTHGSFFGKTIVRLMWPGRDLPFYRFTSGDLVTLCRSHPLRERCWEGLVLDRSRREIRLVTDAVPPGLTNGTWRLDQGVNMALYLRCAAALKSLYRPQQDQDAAGSSGTGGTSQPSQLQGNGQEQDEEEEEEEYQGSGQGGTHGSQHHHRGGRASDHQGEGEGGPGQGGYGSGWGGGRGGGRGRGGQRGGGGGRGRGRGGGKRRRNAEEEEEDQLPAGTHLLDVLLQLGGGRSPAAAAAQPSQVMPAAALRWAADCLARVGAAGGTGVGAAGGARTSGAGTGAAGRAGVTGVRVGAAQAGARVNESGVAVPRAGGQAGTVGVAQGSAGVGAGGAGAGGPVPYNWRGSVPMSLDDVATSRVAATCAVEEDESLGLNNSQLAAVALAVQNRTTVLQGPPGTGKTSTITRFLALLTQRLNLTVPILACAQSNVAVDNLLEGLTSLGVRALRVGQPAKVRASLRDATLDARLMEHPLQAEIQGLAGELSAHMRRLPSMQGRDRGLGHRDASLMRKQLQELKKQMSNSVLQGAQVICSTCIGVGSEMLAEMTFPLVVLDEGSQATELECLIPLTKGARHVVLVGDHHQLPPVVNSSVALSGGMAVSLMERLIHAGVPSALLQVQYRMHPALSAFPTDRFYAGRLVDGVKAEDRPRPAGLQWPTDLPVMFVDVQGEEVARQGGSKANPVEAGVCGRVVAALLRGGTRPQDIGLVTPYAAQVQLLTDQVQRVLQKHRPPPAPAAEGSREEDVWQALPGPPEPELEVKSVDGYQGREKQVIVFSSVRSNPRGQVGFLDDWRRLNVAITRARCGLVLVGHAATLSAGDPHWAALVEHLTGRGCVVQLEQLGLPQV